MKSHHFTAMLNRYLDTYQWLLRHRKKAARKEKNRKKWYARYGGGLTEELQNPSPLLAKIPKNQGFTGNSIPVPFLYSVDKN